MDKAPGAFRTISEVADEIDVPQHVLRFWESRFTQIRPMKRGGGGSAPARQTFCTKGAPCSRKMRCTPRMV